MRCAMLLRLTPLLPSAQSVLMLTCVALLLGVPWHQGRLTSATRSPVTTAYAQHATNAVLLAPKPLSSVTAGSARMPAPTVVPATRADAPHTLPG